jgi:anti-sigma factor RsiW
MNCEEAQELLEAFHDGELTAETRSAVAAHVKSCTVCSTALARLDDLSAAIKSVGAFPVPDRVRRNVERRIAELDRSSGTARRNWMFGALAASHIGVAALGGLAAYSIVNGQLARSYDEKELVSAHVRSLIDDRLIQVVSSDTHTVRPWFAGKLDFAPSVEDLGQTGYPLLGGRVDYVDGDKVAALVYGHDKHIINVFVSPKATGAGGSTERNGYNIVAWKSRDLHYQAISDLSAPELDDFARQLQAKLPH